MPTPPSRGFVRSRLDPSPPEPDLTPRDPPFRPRQALAESRAAGASDSPDAPRPLPARPRPPPGGAVELGVVESDEAMAQRLQREERERANASSRDAFYPNMPYDPARRAPPSTVANDPRPSFLAPVPHPAPAPAFSFPRPPGPPPPSAPPPTTESLGRRAMNDEIALNTGKPEGTWTAPVLRDGSYTRDPPSPYYPPTPTGRSDSGWGDRPGACDPIGAASGANGGGGSAEDDEALARALQAREEEEEGRRGVREARRRAGRGLGTVTRRSRLGYRRRRTPPPPGRPRGAPRGCRRRRRRGTREGAPGGGRSRRRRRRRFDRPIEPTSTDARPLGSPGRVPRVPRTGVGVRWVRHRHGREVAPRVFHVRGVRGRYRRGDLLRDSGRRSFPPVVLQGKVCAEVRRLRRIHRVIDGGYERSGGNERSVHDAPVLGYGVLPRARVRRHAAVRRVRPDGGEGREGRRHRRLWVARLLPG